MNKNNVRKQVAAQKKHKRDSSESSSKTPTKAKLKEENRRRHRVAKPHKNGGNRKR